MPPGPGRVRPPGGIAPQGLELRHLRYLVAVADAGTFTDAAERMFIAQPTLGQQIRRLEEMVGAPLLQRRREGGPGSRRADAAYDHPAILGEPWSVPAGLAARVPVPALVMAGDAGLPFMPDAARVLSQAMPRGRLRMLPGQTHAVNPGVLAPILAEFFGSY